MSCIKKLFIFSSFAFIPLILTHSVSASSIAPANNQLYAKGVGWQSFNTSNELGVSAGRWITGQRGVVSIAGQSGKYFSGSFDFYTRYPAGSGYYQGGSSNLQCFATQNGTLWNAIGNTSFQVNSFNISHNLGNYGAYYGYWHIYGTFSGQSNSTITSSNNFACEFFLPDSSNQLIFQNGNAAANFAQGNGNVNSSIEVYLSDNNADAIANLQAALTAQNEKIQQQNEILINQGQATQNAVNQGFGDVNNNLQQQLNQGQATQNKMEQGFDDLENAISDGADKTISAIENQSRQEQEQYEQDKKEESEREQAGKDSNDQLGGLFNFTVLNPVAGLLKMFKPSECVSIPTIAGMLGSNETQYCPWFPAKVRNILTPVIGLTSTIFIFGFVVSWLNGGDSNGRFKLEGGFNG